MELIKIFNSQLLSLKFKYLLGIDIDHNYVFQIVDRKTESIVFEVIDIETNRSKQDFIKECIQAWRLVRPKNWR